jgi:hypothetical protein
LTLPNLSPGIKLLMHEADHLSTSVSRLRISGAFNASLHFSSRGTQRQLLLSYILCGCVLTKVLYKVMVKVKVNFTA